MSTSKAAIKEKEAPRIGVILQLARMGRQEPILPKGDKKYRLITYCRPRRREIADTYTPLEV